ncbi:hypothetical protein KIW84_062915 [Lathyrus oleraceus]|uniref:DUF7745 domain-containing protein n=1 Tax=Pisum sativum TaxID=3888 RepID=A0A9D5A644_PEA|nr:hypothetical protein KIW84_062915 [Pisum sativum]
MESSKRNIYSFKFKDPDLRSLRSLISQMHPVYRINFGKNYGNLLSILNQQVDHTALITLAQFYDLPLRCFTFQDFQLAPTLEEFERLVRIPMKDKSLFEGTDESLPLEDIASALHMDEKEAKDNLETKGNTKGFSLSFLLERAHTLLKAESWDACYSAIALAIYGIVLFPNMDGFIDMTAICVFLTRNPVPTLLADVYYHISHRYTKKKGLIACCAPLLYQWFLEHLPKTGAWDEQTDISWPQRLGSLRSEDLSCSITQTTRLPNGRPSRGNSLEAFLLLDFGAENPSLFQRIKEAWKNVNRKGKAELGRANGITKEPYFQWVKERVQIIKMPFVIRMPIPLPEPKLTHVPIEEMEELKATMAKLEKENEELQTKLQQTINEKNNMKWELERKEAQLQAHVEKFNKEEHKRKKIKMGLEQADHCLDTLKGQLRQTQKECQDNEHWWHLATKENKTIRDTLGAQIKELTNSVRQAKAEVDQERRLKKIATEASRVSPMVWEEKCREVRDARESVSYWKNQLESLRQDSSIWLKERDYVIEDYESFKKTIDFLQGDRDKFRAKLDGLVGFCNWAAEELPWRLRDAVEELKEDSTPPAIINFVMLCKGLLKRFNEELKELQARKPAV